MAEDCMYERLNETVDWSNAPEQADFYSNGLWWRVDSGNNLLRYLPTQGSWRMCDNTANSLRMYTDYQKRPVVEASPELETEVQKTVGKHFNPKSTDLLDEVKSIQQQRASEYEQDGGERSFQKIATIYNTLRGTDLKPSDVALILCILKDVRFYSQDGLHRDSVIDKISYSSLWGELIMQERGV